MNESRVPAHRFASARTLFVAVTGFGAAALVTSFSVLSVDSVDAAIRVAVIGGTSVLGISSLVVAVCTTRLPTGDDKLPWVLIALALALTTAGSALRASAFLTDWRGISAGTAEGVYAIGLVVLMVAAVVWPLRHRRGVSLAVAFALALALTAGLSAVTWFWFGAGMIRAAFEGGLIEPARLRQLLGLMVVMTAVAAFSATSARALRDEPRSGPQIMVAAAVFAVVAGDVYWLSRMTGGGWAPGSFGDFVHLAGHVLLATAASLALDIGLAERDATR